MQVAITEGDIQFAVCNSNSLTSRHVIPLAVASETRVSWSPLVPTFREIRLGGIVVTQWFGFVAPARTSRRYVEKFSEEVGKVLNDNDVVEKLRILYLGPAMRGAREFDVFFKEEILRSGRIVQETGARVD